MTRTAAAEEPPQAPFASTFLAAWPAGPGERRLAFAVVVASLAFFAAAAPFAKQPLPQVWAFIPAYAAALIVSDLVTAVLLFGQFRIARSKAVLVLATGYVFTALVTVAHGLSFPGLLAPGGLLGAGPQTTAWLYMFWHGGFPAFVGAYALLRGSRHDFLAPVVPAPAAIAAAVGVAAAAVIAFTLLATRGHDALPAIMQGNRYTPAMLGVVTMVWLASPVALVLLWRRRPHSVLDLWLMVVLCAWLLDVALSAVLNAGRFDVGFYLGRVYGLLAANFVLCVLLFENGLLHARLMDAHAQEQRRAFDLQRLSQRLEAVNTKLADSNVQLQEQTRAKSEFLASMSHELRTPLNSIIGFSDLLKEGVSLDGDKTRRFAHYISQSGAHLLSLINDILDLSKIEAGKVEILLEPVHLSSALSDATAMLANQARAKQVKLTIEPGDPLASLHVDRRRLRQILLNLAANAIKFTPPGGEVTVRAQSCDRSRAATALPGGGEGLRMPLPHGAHERFVEISVTDTGIGIAAGDLAKLFSPFSQVPSVATREGEGTGLGLVVVHRLAELHGGTIAVTSRPGSGSCFTVWLPWRDAKPDAPAPRAEPQRRRLALVVEDDDAAAALMRAQLETEGFDVRHLGSAEAALACVGEFTPDLITLDVVLPGMDGWQFLAQIKATRAWEAVPVVVVSVLGDEGRGFSLGASFVLQKPVDRDALARALQGLGLATKAARDITVLVIDDDASAVELIAAQLRQRDHAVLRALGGREGIELAQRFRPDLITLDLEMPDVNGFDVVEALKGMESTAQIPIVVVTAKELDEADRRRLNGHIRDVVGKSSFHAGFVAEVQRALSKLG
jgi:signal transduction histidine kinase/CheY-like chemotaxis protein